MLHIIDPTRYDQWAYSPFGTVWLISLKGAQPTFWVNTKPRATDANELGNTEVDHIQFFGMAYPLMGLIATGFRVRPGDYPKNIWGNVSYSYEGAGSYDVLIPMGCGWIKTKVEYSPKLSYPGYAQYHMYKQGLIYSPWGTLGIAGKIYAYYDTVYDPNVPGGSGKIVRLSIIISDYAVDPNRPRQAGNSYASSELEAAIRRYCGKSPHFDYRNEGRGYSAAYVSWRDDFATKETVYLRFTEGVLAFNEVASNLKFHRGGGNYGYHPLTGVGPTLNTQDFFRLKDLFMSDSRLWVDRNPIPQALLGDATLAAVESARYFEGNGLAYLKEGRELMTTVKSLIQLLTGHVSPKTLSSLWLSARYGLRLTALDTEELVNGVLRAVEDGEFHHGFARSRGKEGEARCILYYSESPGDALNAVNRFLTEWDLFPSLTNLWDFVPYSFVVDWFLGVEHLTRALDARRTINTFDVFSTCYTFKREVPVPHVWHELVGAIRVTQFLRMTPKVPIQPPLTLRGSLPSKINIIDGAALIVAR